MARMRVTAISLVAAAVAAVATGAAAQTPGEVPVYGTYQGSTEQQRRDAEAAAQVQAENQAMQQRLDETYKSYAPGGAGAPRGGGGGAQVPPLKSKPLLPAAKNPLLGRWQQTGAKPVDLGFLREMPGASVVDGAFAGGCQSIFGKAGVVFTPTQLNWLATDGHEEILNLVEYRSDGANIIVIPTDSDLPLIFGMPNHDHVVVAFLGCTMQRLAPNTKPVSFAAQPPPAATATAAVPTGQAVLNLTVGEMNSGNLSAPPAGTRIFLTNQNPDASLVRAGFAPDAGGQPIDKLFAACRLGQGGDAGELQSRDGRADRRHRRRRHHRRFGACSDRRRAAGPLLPRRLRALQRPLAGLAHAG